MTTKVSDGMTSGLVKDSNLASKAPVSKSAGDEGKVVQLDSTGAIPTVYGGGKIIQRAFASTSAVATGTTVMVADDTIPQITEGNEAITLAITPTSASSRLIIVANVFQSAAVSADNCVTALFQDSTADALAAVVETLHGSTYPLTTTLVHEMVSGTTSATTFKVRAGQTATGTWTLNGWSGARKLGGVASTTLTILEIEA